MLSEKADGKMGKFYGASPMPLEIKQARKDAGLSQTAAAELIHFKLRSWQDWEYGISKMHPSAWELFLIKTNRSN